MRLNQLHVIVLGLLSCGLGFVTAGGGKDELSPWYMESHDQPSATARQSAADNDDADPDETIHIVIEQPPARDNRPQESVPQEREASCIEASPWCCASVCVYGGLVVVGMIIGYSFRLYGII